MVHCSSRYSKCKYLSLGGLDIAQLFAILFYIYLAYLILKFILFTFKLVTELSGSDNVSCILNYLNYLSIIYNFSFGHFSKTAEYQNIVEH